MMASKAFQEIRAQLIQGTAPAMRRLAGEKEYITAAKMEKIIAGIKDER